MQSAVKAVCISKGSVIQGPKGKTAAQRVESDDVVLGTGHWAHGPLRTNYGVCGLL